MKCFNKKFGGWNLVFFKLSVASLTLFVVSVWIGFRNWVFSVNYWWFFAAFVILGAIPFFRTCLKKKRVKKKK